MRYKILMNDKPTKDLLKKIRDEHSQDIEGIDELYTDLIEDGTCESIRPARIYYVAYTLALENIELTLVKMQ